MQQRSGSRFSTRSLARMSATHAKTTIAVWVVVLVAALGLNNAWGADALTNDFSFTGNPESQVARDLVDSAFGESFQEVIIVQSERYTVDDAEFQQQVEAAFAIAEPHEALIAAAGHYYINGNIPDFVSRDRHTLMIPYVLDGELHEATAAIEPVLEQIMAANEATDDFLVAIVGQISFQLESNELSVSDIEKGERFGVPVALLILLALFGAVVAALIPLFLAIVAIITALGMVAIIGQFYQMVFFVTMMISMIGLAVGIDYSLIVVSRFREELARGRSKLDAIEVAGATASRTVFFSGLTVVLALSGMLIVPTSIFQSLGLGAILVVIAAVAATLTLLPAALSILGTKVNRLRLPLFGRRLAHHEIESTGGFWNFVTRLVMGRPVLFLGLAAGLMIAAAVPALDLNQGFIGIDVLPDRLQSKQAFEVMDKEFSFGAASPADIVIQGDASDPTVVEAIPALRKQLSSDPDFVGFSTVVMSDSGDVTRLAVPVAGEPSSVRAISAVTRLRDDIVPAAFAGVAVQAFVGGGTSSNIDFFAVTDGYTFIVFAFVLGLSFILLTVAFRSIVIPLKSILLNLLSVGAAYGMLVLVFQKGWGADILGFQQSPIIDAWIPLFLFTVLFGLSMDYHVFLLSRVRERYDITGDNAGSVAYGLRSTAGLITDAALIMVAVFSGFAAGESVGNQQAGFGLGIAVFLDATIVRSILVPASMRLLGKVNWYYPSFLEWIPNIGIEGREEPLPAPAGASD
ncbi:MAG: MMPL family transporter [Chloroflexi bacterium]|nr:MMPL family transporter [Chloroflexota bacterium]